MAQTMNRLLSAPSGDGRNALREADLLDPPRQPSPNDDGPSQDETLAKWLAGDP